MTIQRLCKFSPFTLGQGTACRSFTFLMLLALVLIGLPALSGAQQTCQPDGDVDQNGSVTAADALLAFQQALGLAELDMCQLTIANVFPSPAMPDGNITASDALCIFQRALSLPSCLDTPPSPNEPPMADAGSDQTVDAGTIVTLSGTADDTDGTIASYVWEQTGGSTVLLSGADGAIATFAAPDVSMDGTLTFRLTVTDNDGAQTSDEVMIVVRRVNKPPIVNAGADQSVDAGVIVALSGTARDLDGNIASYLWEQTEGTMSVLSGTTSATAMFTAPDVSVDETLTFRITVTDNDGAQASDEVNVTVRPVNMPPIVIVEEAFPSVAEAGVTVFLIGTASDPDGTIVSYLWEQTGGTMVSLAGATSATAMFTAPDVPADETLTFRLTVTDNDGDPGSDEVVVNVAMVVLRNERFISVSAGDDHTCGVRETGSVACWGNDEDDQSTPPEGLFISVDAGDNHTCAVRKTGAVACWGRNNYGQATPPEDVFVSVSAGEAHTCGIRETGAVACWGRNDDGQATPPEGIFDAVSAGRYFTCGIRETDAVVCWGIDNFRQLASPGGAFASVSAGDSYACGIRETGAVVCWGDTPFDQAIPREGLFTSVSTAVYHACGVRDTGSVVCWGDGALGQDQPPEEGVFISVSTGLYHTCGVRETNVVVCWGSNDFGQAPPLAGAFSLVSAGREHACGLDRTGIVACWGDDSLGQSMPPEKDIFTSVSAGDYHACGIDKSGAVACWGDNVHGQSMPPEGIFVSISAGGQHTCGVRNTGTVACWGDPTQAKTAPPAGIFTSVSAGEQHTCGVRNTGAVACWGRNTDRQSMPLAGGFISISAGGGHTCGIRSTGAVACWGDNAFGQSIPSFDDSQALADQILQLEARAHFLELQSLQNSLEGITDPDLAVQIGEIGAELLRLSAVLGIATAVESGFTSISAGDYHTCGIVGTGVVVCWGDNDDGQSTPPGSIFVSVSAGTDYTCGVRETGSMVCWGAGFQTIYGEVVIN